MQEAAQHVPCEAGDIVVVALVGQAPHEGDGARREDGPATGMLEEDWGIGSCGVPRPSLGDYVAGTGPRGAGDAAGECSCWLFSKAGAHQGWRPRPDVSRCDESPRLQGRDGEVVRRLSPQGWKRSVVARVWVGRLGFRQTQEGDDP